MLAAACTAQAKPLTTQECTSLVEEHAKLSSKNIEKLMDQDPIEASEKLNPNELAEIERFLFVEGQIRFRCPAVKLKVPPPPELEVREATNQADAKKKGTSAIAESEPVNKGPRVPFPDRNPKRR